MPWCLWGQKNLPAPLLSTNHWEKLSSEAHNLKVGSCTSCPTPCTSQTLGKSGACTTVEKYVSETMQKDTNSQKGLIYSLGSLEQFVPPQSAQQGFPTLPPSDCSLCFPPKPAPDSSLFRKIWGFFCPPLTMRENGHP